jgi:hypothetical protein
MRYFRIGQYSQAEKLLNYKELVNISELEKVAPETTEQEAQTASWGSGTISVDSEGNWKTVASNYDSSD